jgi:hypothetical protein
MNQRKTKVFVECPICGVGRIVSKRQAKSPKPCRSCSTKLSWQRDEYKKSIAAAASKNTKRRWQDPELRKSLEKSLATDEVRAKLSASTTKNWQNQDYQKHISETSKAVGATPQVRAKRSATAKALQLNTDFRNKSASAIKTAMAHEDVRQKISKNNKTRWLDPIYRSHMIKVLDKARAAALIDPAIKQKLAVARAAQLGRLSSIQKMLYAFLDDLNIVYLKEGPKTRLGYYVFDCLVVHNNKKILIECQGDYWHSLDDAIKNDKSKFTYISRYFPEYEIMYVWEHEFYCKDRVLDRLKLKLGINIETKEFKFSELQIREINSSEVKTFLDLYHYLGKDRGGKAFGAFDGDLLIAAIVFSPPLRQNTAGQFGLISGEVRELSRLCIHPSYHKKNFASWFIKRTLKRIDCKLVVAYADTTVGHDGGIYKASNFKLHHIVPADYWYVDTLGYVMHKRTLYGKAKSLKLTESEFAEAKGYIKKYGGEKLCFVKDISY